MKRLVQVLCMWVCVHLDHSDLIKCPPPSSHNLFHILNLQVSCVIVSMLQDVEANTVRLKEHGQDVLVLEKIPAKRESGTLGAHFK